MGGRRAAVALAGGLALCGCAATQADPIAPREEGVEVVAPSLEPPPASAGALSREEALELIRDEAEPGEAVRALDRRRFDFALDDEDLAWFGRRGVAPTVYDYLEKRARVEWESLRGDVDPDGPAPE